MPNVPEAERTDTFHLDVYIDVSTRKKYGNGARKGFIIFVRLSVVVHPIYWESRKFLLVARSSATVEIISSADSIDIALHLRALLLKIPYEHPIDLTSDSGSVQVFYNTTSTKYREETLNKIDLVN